MDRQMAKLKKEAGKTRAELINELEALRDQNTRMKDIIGRYERVVNKKAALHSQYDLEAEMDSIESLHNGLRERQKQIDLKEEELAAQNAKLRVRLGEINARSGECARANQALLESEEKFRALAESTNAGIVLFRDDRYIYVNPMVEKALGYTKGELLAMNTWDIIHPDYRELVRGRGHARLQGLPVPSRYEVRVLTKGGGTIWAEFSAAVIEYQGQPTVIATIFDVTERKRVEGELKAAKLQAELYVDLMGHDINNMHQIALGYLELAREIQPGVEQAALLDKSEEVLKRSTKLIGNVRKLQKLHEGVFQAREMDVCKVLADTQSEYGAVPGKTITLNLNGHKRCVIRANELLHDVFANLVNNAVKHIKDGTEITISLDAIDESRKPFYRVAVEDNGPGITDAFKERIFNRMQKDTASGTGLGLYLVKSLVKSYGGRVWVEDRVPGDHTKGARFVVLLPAVNNK